MRRDRRIPPARVARARRRVANRSGTETADVARVCRNTGRIWILTGAAHMLRSSRSSSTTTTRACRWPRRPSRTGKVTLHLSARHYVASGQSDLTRSRDRSLDRGEFAWLRPALPRCSSILSALCFSLRPLWGFIILRSPGGSASSISSWPRACFTRHGTRYTSYFCGYRFASIGT